MYRLQVREDKYNYSAIGRYPGSVGCECPNCGEKVMFTFFHNWSKIHNTASLYAPAECGNCNAKSHFYWICRPSNDDTRNIEEYQLFIHPKPQIKATIPENVANVSPLFKEIYDQAMIADREGLNLIVGMSLRKALEFLVKDFLISEESNDRNTIENKRLYLCIKDHFPPGNLKDSLTVSVWLANDETHYLRNHDDMDLEDLKGILSLTISEISNRILVKEIKNRKNKKG